MRNPHRKFDVILNNTSFNWREHTTNLLSVEFLELIRRHLKPGGVYYYNTTDSERALRTGAAVFPYVVRVANFEAVSDSPLNLDAERWRQTLASYRIDGKPVFDLGLPRDQERMEELVSFVKTAEHPTVEGQDPRPTMENGDSIRRRTAGSRVITDDNMGTEWTPPGHIPGNAPPPVSSQGAPQR